MIIDERLSQNYDYCYLESMHWLFSSGKVKASNIICGLSYGLDAIETNYIKEPTINRVEFYSLSAYRVDDCSDK